MHIFNTIEPDNRQRIEVAINWNTCLFSHILLFNSSVLLNMCFYNSIYINQTIIFDIFIRGKAKFTVINVEYLHEKQNIWMFVIYYFLPVVCKGFYVVGDNVANKWKPEMPNKTQRPARKSYSTCFSSLHC